VHYWAVHDCQGGRAELKYMGVWFRTTTTFLSVAKRTLGIYFNVCRALTFVAAFKISLFEIGCSGLALNHINPYRVKKSCGC
jgi:hypothetical protein